MRAFLKIKIKTLAAEARFIRQLAKRYEKRILIRTTIDRLTNKPHEKWKVVRNNPVRLALHAHRTGDVRIEQRLSLLAYAYMRGVPLIMVDRNTSRLKGNKFVPVIDWAVVKNMAKRFGADVAGFDDWTRGVRPAIPSEGVAA